MHKSKGNAIGSTGPPTAMGADVMRWLYCRQQSGRRTSTSATAPPTRCVQASTSSCGTAYASSATTRGSGRLRPGTRRSGRKPPADLLAWNTPTAGSSSTRSVAGRTTGRADEYEHVQRVAFCLEAERFVDDKLTNWYVRRNRRRFWRGEPAPTSSPRTRRCTRVLATLTRLIAPIVPFLAETMWQNLRRAGRPRQRAPVRFPGGRREPHRRRSLGGHRSAAAPRRARRCRYAPRSSASRWPSSRSAPAPSAKGLRSSASPTSCAKSSTSSA